MTQSTLRVALIYPSSAHGSPEQLAHAVARLRAQTPEAEVIEWFDRQISELVIEDRERLASVDVAVVLDDPGPLLPYATKLAWVQSVTTGIDHIDLGALAASSVRLTTAGGTSSPEIGEFVVARLLEHWKRLPEIAELQRHHEWVPAYGAPLRGSHIVLVGFGAINRAVARLLEPFGVQLTAVRRSIDDDAGDGVVRVISVEDLDDALALADAVVVAVPATRETEGMFDEHRFGRMRRGAFFCNVGRGSAVVEPALIDALASGRLGGAAVDVTCTEPMPAVDPLWESGVRVSPHCSSVPAMALARVLELVPVNAARLRDGRPMLNEISFSL